MYVYFHPIDMLKNTDDLITITGRNTLTYKHTQPFFITFTVHIHARKR